MREPNDDVSPEVWREWILEAIRKIRFQKQRPSIQRICQAIGSHHKFHEDIVAEKLEEAVESGAVIKVYNKGLHSYKTPMAKRKMTVNKDTDLSRLIAKAVRELGECAGSTLKSIENYVMKSNNFEMVPPETDIKHVISNSLKVALRNELLIQDGKLYKVGKSLTGTPRKRRSSSPRKKNNDNENASPKSSTAHPKSPAANKVSPRLLNSYNSFILCLYPFQQASVRKKQSNGSSCEGCGISINSTINGRIPFPSSTQKLKVNYLTQLSALESKGCKWYCDKCRSCAECHSNDRGFCLLGCCECEKNFHFSCLNPVPDKKPKCPWR